MRRYLSTLLALCLCCGMLAGCGGKEKTVTEDFDSATNQSVTIGNCNLKVPQNWAKGDNSSSTALYYYPEDGMLMVGYSEMDKSISDDDARGEFIEGFSKELEGFELKEETECEVDGNKAYRYDVSTKISGDDYDTTMVIFDNNDGIMSLIFGDLKSSEKDHSKDFEKIVNSVRVLLPFERKISEADALLSILAASDNYDFTASGIDVLEDGSSMETMVDPTNGILITLLGDSEENMTVVHTTAKDEEGIATAAAMTLVGADVLSTNASEFLAHLSEESLKSMEKGMENAKIEVIDGVSYMLSKSDSGEYQYTFSFQRDNETKEDYESYLKYRELLDND